MLYNKRYLPWCITCQKYSNLCCFMLSIASHSLPSFSRTLVFLTLSVQVFHHILLHAHISKVCILFDIASVSVHAPAPYSNVEKTKHLRSLRRSLIFLFLRVDIFPIFINNLQTCSFLVLIFVYNKFQVLVPRHSICSLFKVKFSVTPWFLLIIMQFVFLAFSLIPISLLTSLLTMPLYSRILIIMNFIESSSLKQINALTDTSLHLWSST